MPENDQLLLFNFHWDRDVSIDLVHTVQLVYPLVSLFTLHPTVLYILIRHPGSLSKNNRAGYIAFQITLIFYEFTMCWFIRLYPLMPYPALYCDGPLCRIGLPQQTIMALVAIAVVLPNPPFYFLLVSVHQKILINTKSRARLSLKVQKWMMISLIALLLLNVLGITIFCAPSDGHEEIRNRPELAWLNDRGGQLLIFGDVGNPENFAYEGYFLIITIIATHSFVIFISVHATFVIQSAKKYTTNATAILQRRIMSVLLIQLGTVFLFYCLPLSLFAFASLFLLSPEILMIVRPMLVIIRQWIQRAVHFVIPCIGRKRTQSVSSIPTFSISFPSESFSRPLTVI